MTDPAELAELIRCIDLTDLSPGLDNTEINNKLNTLCEQAVTPYGAVAAVCIYPEWVSQAWQYLIATPVKIATVINFPGTDYLSKDIPQAILDGATEIDAVMPHDDTGGFVAECKYYCGNKALLKVILESGDLSLEELQKKSQLAIRHGADFLKTSTGKGPVGATPEAARVILDTIKAHEIQSGKRVGFKASGGVSTLNDAGVYVKLVKEILGPEACTPEYFRIGASRLLQDILCAFPKQS